jgi:hypothetical protein
MTQNTKDSATRQQRCECINRCDNGGIPAD